MYDWALNKTKLWRAVAQVGESDEKQLMDAYIKIGGLIKVILPTGLSDEQLSNEIKTAVNIDAKGEPITYDEAPKKKRGRPKKV